MNDDITPLVDEPEAAATPAKDWTLDDGARARIDRAMEDIEAVQSHYPVCVVCGQRALSLDKFGTCSKTSDKSEPHRLHRNEMRAGVRA